MHCHYGRWSAIVWQSGLNRVGLQHGPPKPRNPRRTDAFPQNWVNVSVGRIPHRPRRRFVHIDTLQPKFELFQAIPEFALSPSSLFRTVANATKLELCGSLFLSDQTDWRLQRGDGRRGFRTKSIGDAVRSWSRALVQMWESRAEICRV